MRSRTVLLLSHLALVGVAACAEGGESRARSTIARARDAFPELTTTPEPPHLEADARARALSVRVLDDRTLELTTRGHAFRIAAPNARGNPTRREHGAVLANAHHFWIPAGQTAETGDGWRTDRVDETWVIDEARGTHEATYEVTLPPGVRGVRDAGDYLEFHDSEGDPVLRFHPSIVRDAKGDSRTGSTTLAGLVAGTTAGRFATGNSLRVTTSVSLDGLTAPLVVDPGWSSTASMATARSQHGTALLSDGSVLVVGGVNRLGFVSTAERFDPSTGTWSARAAPGSFGNVTTTISLPDGRVYVVGDGGTCRVYDDRMNAWSNAPCPRGSLGVSMVVLRDKRVLIAGGNSADADLYDPATNTLSPAGTMAVARRFAGSAMLADGRVLLAGGFASSGEVGSATIYDPTTNAWTEAAPMLFPRHYFTTTALLDGRVLVAGGYTVGGVTTHAEIYDPAANTWTATGALNSPRNGHSALRLPTGKVVVLGGSLGNRTTVTATEVYDPATGLWSVTGNLAVGRENAGAVLLPNGRALFVGGHDSSGGTAFFANAEVYDSGDEWSASAGSLALARARAATTLLPTGEILAVGGTTSAATGELFDPATDLWQPAAPPPMPVSDGAAVVLQNGRVLVIDGPTRQAALYDAATDSWSDTGDLTTARQAPLTHLLADGRVLVVNHTGALSSEMYVPATGTWTAIPAHPSFPLRQDTVTAVLRDGRVMAVTNEHGLGASIFFDPATNTWGGGTAITGRVGQTLTLLPNGRVLLAGGVDQSNAAVPGAQLYDPASDTWTSAGVMIEPRRDHTATLLPSGLVLVEGGVDGGGVSRSRGEIYNPLTNTWRIAAAASSVSGRHAAIALPHDDVATFGGDVPTATNRVRLNRPPDSSRPVVSGVDDAFPGCAATLVGTRFRGNVRGGASGGYLDTAGDLPLVRLLSIDGRRHFAPVRVDGSDTSVTVQLPATIPPGFYGASVFSNAVAGGRVIEIRENRAPVAEASTVSTGMGRALSITLVANDADAGQTVSYVVDAPPAHGTLSGNAPNLTYTPAPGFLGTDTFTFHARDCGLDSEVVTVTIRVADGTAPVLTCPPQQSAEATSAAGAGVAYPDATATDDVTQALVITYSVISGETFPLGTTTVTASTSDEAGNAASCTFEVLVDDTTPPGVGCPSDVTVEASSPAGAQVPFESAQATDAVTTNPSLVASHSPGSTFPLGTTTVTITATDDADNAASCSFDVTIVDTTPPSITCPAPLSVVAQSPEGATVTFTVEATDLASAAPTTTLTHASGSTFPNGTTRVTATTVDGAGLEASCFFDVTVSVGVVDVLGGGCTSTGGDVSLVALVLAMALLTWRRRDARAAITLAGALVVAQAMPAAAQISPFDAERLRLVPAGTDSLTVDTGRVLSVGSGRIALLANHERGLVVLKKSDGSLSPFLAYRVGGWLSGAWSPIDRLELNAIVPVIVAQGIGSVELAGIAPSSFGLGTPELGARYAILRREDGAPLSLGFGLNIGLPGGSSAAFGAQDGWAGTQLSPRIAVSRELGPVVVGANLGARIRASVEQPGGAIGTELEQGIVVATRGDGVRFELGAQLAESLVKAAVAAEVLAVARLPIANGFEAVVLGGKGLTDMAGSPSWRAGAGVSWTWVPVARSSVELQATPIPEPLADASPSEETPIQITQPEEPEPVQSVPPLPATEEQAVLDLSSDRVLFPVGRAVFDETGRADIERIARLLAAFPNVHLQLQGHTDDSGPERLNRQLSLERANAVRDELIRVGISAKRLSVKGFGPSRPRAKEQTDEARTQNRRVEFIVSVKR